MTIVYTTASWNPVIGCSPALSGCMHCYAAREASTRLAHLPDYAGLTRDGKWTGAMRERGDKMWLTPIRRQKPQTYFVCSTSDLFHPNADPAWRDRVWATMALSPQHTFYVLTKRPEVAAEHLNDAAFYDRVLAWADTLRCEHRAPVEVGISNPSIHPLTNVCFGASASNEVEAAAQVQALRQVPASIRWLSLEPLLERVSLAKLGIIEHDATWSPTDPSNSGKLQGHCEICSRVSPGFEKRCKTMGMVYRGLDWVVVGGESGPGARPFALEWAHVVVKECVEAHIPVYMKQTGSNASCDGLPFRTRHRKGEGMEEWPPALQVRQRPDRTRIVHDGSFKLTYK